MTGSGSHAQDLSYDERLVASVNNQAVIQEFKMDTINAS